MSLTKNTFHELINRTTETELDNYTDAYFEQERENRILKRNYMMYIKEARERFLNSFRVEDLENMLNLFHIMGFLQNNDLEKRLLSQRTK